VPYRFAAERPNYSDVASGRVFASQPASPGFPVRLASEIFQRCLAIRRGQGLMQPCALYDPCCGAGYLLGVVAYLHGESIRSLAGSDISAKAVALAARNLSLLTLGGIERRISEIEELLDRYGKESHRDALASARVFRERVMKLESSRPVQVHVFQADALDGAAMAAGLDAAQVDVVLTDVPYGQHSQWQGAPSEDPIGGMLAALSDVLLPDGLVAVASDKQQKAAHPLFQRVDHFQVGRRKVVILQLEAPSSASPDELPAKA